jgi:hypothetical protein
MKIKIDSRLYLSELGAKGFLYPSDNFITAATALECDTVQFVYSKERGVVPVRIVAQIGEEGLSTMEATIFWVSKENLENY